MSAGRRFRVKWLVALLIVFAVLAALWFRSEGILPVRKEGPAQQQAAAAQGEYAPQDQASGDKPALDGREELTAADCGEREDLQDWDARIQRQKDEVRNAMPILEQSTDPELRFAAALFARNDSLERFRHILVAAVEMDPGNPMLIQALLKDCLFEKGAVCDVVGIRDIALQVDRANGATWLLLVSSYLQADDFAAAENAARNAIAAPKYDSYYGEQIAAIERGLAVATDWPYAERVVYAIGYAAAQWAPFGDIVSQCKNPQERTASWADLCEQLGQTMFTESKTLMDRSLGQSLTEIVADRTGELELRFRSNAMREALDQHMDVLQRADLENLLMSDERVLREWLEHQQTYGETEAYRRLKIEAGRLRALPGYNQCNFIATASGQ